MASLGGVTDLLLCPFVRVRKQRPAARFFEGVGPDRVRRVGAKKSPDPCPAKHGTAAADVQNARRLPVKKESSNRVLFTELAPRPVSKMEITVGEIL